jgi:uncharacterized protein YrrD
MKMKASDLNGMAVVSLQEGAKLGQVDQPLFDLSARQLCALHVKGDSGISVLPFDQIEKIGSDAITVTTSQVTRTPGAASVGQGQLDLQALRKLKIVDRDGTYLGTLSEIDFDPQSGQVTQLTAHKGGVMGVGGTTTPIDVGSTLTVGTELLTVHSEIASDDDAPPSGRTTPANRQAPATEATSANEEAPGTRPPLSPDDPW